MRGIFLYALLLVFCPAFAQEEDGSSDSFDKLSRRECQEWPFYRERIHPLIVKSDYEPSDSPPGDLTAVNVTAQISDVGSLDDHERLLTLTVTLLVSYQDIRLKYPSECQRYNEDMQSEAPLVIYDVDEMTGLLWSPLINVHRLNRAIPKKLFHDYTTALYYKQFHSFNIYGFFDLRIKCQVNYARYPFDSQQCVLRFTTQNIENANKQGAKSFLPPEMDLTGKNISVISLQWGRPLHLARGLNQSAIVANTKNPGHEDLSGNWHQNIYQMRPKKPGTEENPQKLLEIVFEFQRYRTSHILQTFFPSLLLVGASMMSLWVPSGLVPGRMALAVTTTLTLMSMINSVFAEAPRTSYVKAVDLWLIASFGFTFGALIEYCIVLYLIKDQDWYDSKKKMGKNANEGKLKIAFIVEKWSGFLMPLIYIIFVVLFTFYYYPTQIFTYNTDEYEKVPIEIQ